MKLGMIQKVLLAKTKLRDVAAGQLGLLEASHQEARQRTESLRGDIEVLFHQMEVCPPTSAAELLLFDEERQMAKTQIEAAVKVQLQVRRECEQQRKILQERSRALKTTEKAYENFQLMREKTTQKQEQLQNDEFSVRAEP